MKIKNSISGVATQKLKRKRGQHKKDMLCFVHNKQVCEEGVRDGVVLLSTTEMGEFLTEAKPVIYSIACHKNRKAERMKLQRQHYKSIKAIFDVHKLKDDPKIKLKKEVYDRITKRESLQSCCLICSVFIDLCSILEEFGSA